MYIFNRANIIVLGSIEISSGQRYGVIANVLDYDTLVNEFELQSRYLVHFQTITLGKV